MEEAPGVAGSCNPMRTHPPPQLASAMKVLHCPVPRCCRAASACLAAGGGPVQHRLQHAAVQRACTAVPGGDCGVQVPVQAACCGERGLDSLHLPAGACVCVHACVRARVNMHECARTCVSICADGQVSESNSKQGHEECAAPERSGRRLVWVKEGGGGRRSIRSVTCIVKRGRHQIGSNS